MTEKDKLFKKIERLFVRAWTTYGLLTDNDNILIGLSGGKDSLLLTELLARRARIQHPQFDVEAIHVRMENIHYETDTSYLQHFCDTLGIPLHLVTTSFQTNPSSSDPADSSPTLQATKPACFLCSWQRRKQLFNMAQQLGCNKIALGHHQDDLLHTAIMNLLYQGRFGTMPARLQMRKMPLQIIRPLCLIPEKLIIEYAGMSHYEKQVKLCPYEHDTNRTTARHFFEEAERQNPEARFSLWNALQREGKLIEDY